MITIKSLGAQRLFDHPVLPLAVPGEFFVMYFHNIGTNKIVEFVISICQTHFGHKIILKGTCYTKTTDIVNFILQITISYTMDTEFFPGCKAAGA
jgi:hypothetical protein